MDALARSVRGGGALGPRRVYHALRGLNPGSWRAIEPPPSLVAESAEEQATAIRNLLRAPEKAAALGVRARRFVEENYDWEVVFGHLDNIIADCSRMENARQ